MPSVDIKAVKNAISLRSYLEKLLWAYQTSPTGVRRGDCPADPSYRRAARFFVVTEDVFYCWKCRRGGSVIDLHMLRTGYAFLQAVKDLCTFMGVKVPYCDRRKQRVPRKPRNGEEGRCGGSGGEAPPVLSKASHELQAQESDNGSV